MILFLNTTIESHNSLLEDYQAVASEFKGQVSVLYYTAFKVYCHSSNTNINDVDWRSFDNHQYKCVDYYRAFSWT